MKISIPKTKKPDLTRSNLRLIWRVFWEHAKKYPLSVGIIFLSVIIIQSIAITTPWFLKIFLDTAVNSALSTIDAAKQLTWILGVIAALELARWTLHRAFGVANIYLQAGAMNDLTLTAFNNLLGHSYRFFTNNFTGSLVRKVARLSRSFEEITDQIVFHILPFIIISAGILIVLFKRHVILGTALAIWIVLFIGIYYFIANWKLKYDRARAEKDSEATGVLSDALANIVTIKLFSNYAHEKTIYRNVMNELKRLRFWGWGVGEAADAIQALWLIAIELVLFYAWIRLWKIGAATIGDFALIQGYLIALFHRIWDFGKVVRRVYEALADAAEMVEILNTPQDIQDVPGAKPLAISQGGIEFINVAFGFHDHRKVLENFSLRVKPGEKIALVGSSGAGKTTIVTLLLRFHDIVTGKIFIDGQNIAEATQDSLRRSIALVPQDTILFHRTLSENIRYGRLNATEKEIMDAAQKAHCHEFISRLPYGYETYVGERGVKLSGGERQRVAIARAILASTPILVLDEATSSLDSEVEALIQDALKNLLKQKTAIVIAHRLSTIMQMDRIIVIDKGKIAEEGTHAQLLQRDGIYKRLWSLQAERFIPLHF
ncbi:MAG: ABC transporter related protein [Parcubacteria group bacterium GW2011_GWA2_45_30]|nr:MAG: ABC transporter related protein [Parcubacteria group bacterium GW2011_GWA2_45_30]